MNFTSDEKELLKLLVSNKINAIHKEMRDADEDRNDTELKRLLGLHKKYLDLFKKVTGVKDEED